MGLLDRLLGRGVAAGMPSGPVEPTLAGLAAEALQRLTEAPPVDPREELDGVGLLAMDVETTGLDPRRDELLSFGTVPLLGGEVVLAGSWSTPVRPRGEVGGSAVVHGLTDDVLARAPLPAEVLPRVLEDLVGGDGRRRVLVAHFAQVETGFLDALCRAVVGRGLPELQVIDTLEVARRMLGARHDELRPGTLRLDACRRRYGLPRYRAHSALTDAIAAAELLLAQAGETEARQGRPATLGDLLERPARGIFDR